MTRLLYRHPTTVSGVAVNDDGRIATSCFDGVQREFAADGSYINQADVSPGTINQDRQCVAFRFGKIVTGEHDEYAIAIRDDGTICRPANVPTTSQVKGISKRGHYAVALDQQVYNLSAGTHWFIGTLGSERVPTDCAEDANGVWTVGLDGKLRFFSPDGYKPFELVVRTEGLDSVDAEPDGGRLVVADWAYGIWLLDKGGAQIAKLTEFSVVHQAVFGYNGKVIYGTADGRLMEWDGQTGAVAPPTTTAPATKPGGKKHK